MSDKEILRARAKALAQIPEVQADADQFLETIEFRLARESYSFERQFVREVHPFTDLTPLPCTPAFLLGIVSIRGQMLPVMDIKKFFDLPDTGITDLHMIVIIHHDGSEIGILADAVTGLRRVPTSSLQPSLPTLNGIRQQYLKGVNAEQTVVLNALSILTDPKLAIDQQVET